MATTYPWNYYDDVPSFKDTVQLLIPDMPAVHPIVEQGQVMVLNKVNHPEHYGGDNTYETIRVIEAWQLGFNLGNTIKYISRAGKKHSKIEDLEKAKWYLDREIQNIKLKEPNGRTTTDGVCADDIQKPLC